MIQSVYHRGARLDKTAGRAALGSAPGAAFADRKEPMALAAILLLIALLIGGLGLLITGLKWLLIIAIVLIVASALTSRRRR